MNKLVRGFVTVGTALSAMLLVTGVASAATWSSSAAFGSWTDEGYYFNNDVWGSGAGAQTIWANSPGNWGVWSDQPNTGGVKSYPHVGKDVSKTLSALSGVTSNFTVSTPSAGSFETAYDIWANGSGYEIMLWVDKTGSVGPIGSQVATATVGGSTWNVYSGSNGSNPVYSFLRTSNTSSGSVDILAVLKWIESKGWYGDVTLSTVQFGWEISSTNNTGENFADTAFAVNAS
ncbi:MAG TPA: hypothetical protein VG756_03480 [Pseudonocardiaceae bacterium]|jgi:hypothetical protein|nr:hypothetical protein [Pseudonocardiaceae bacterium]